jgi:hypothetical protein
MGGTRRNNRVSKGFSQRAHTPDDASRDLPCSCAPAASGVFDLRSLAARALTVRFPPSRTEKGAAGAFSTQRTDI